ncbi:hypothetical protein F5Y19DRAFT_476732 [Xylariaceae sp. FL1651]|nr:hypothetical protein F5Y19DRAFT_476732 [Xylariaceae sp. FL1651]
MISQGGIDGIIVSSILYIPIVLSLTLVAVIEILREARDKESQRWWIQDSCAWVVVACSLFIAAFVFFFIFTIPVILYKCSRVSGAQTCCWLNHNKKTCCGRALCGSGGRQRDTDVQLTPNQLESQQNESIASGYVELANMRAGRASAKTPKAAPESLDIADNSLPPLYQEFGTKYCPEEPEAVGLQEND